MQNIKLENFRRKYRRKSTWAYVWRTFRYNGKYIIYKKKTIDKLNCIKDIHSSKDTKGEKESSYLVQERPSSSSLTGGSCFLSRALELSLPPSSSAGPDRDVQTAGAAPTFASCFTAFLRLYLADLTERPMGQRKFSTHFFCKALMTGTECLTLTLISWHLTS